MTTHPLFDHAQAAMDAAPARWREAAERTVRWLAMECNSFTADDIWKRLTDFGYPDPPEPRALGGVLRSLARSGLIQQTGTWRKSARAECHHRPIPVWTRAA